MIMQLTNPYWDIVRILPGDEADMKFYKTWSPDWCSSGVDRHELCREYTWAIPDPESLAFVAKWLSPSAVEMGAGTGYWAWLLSQMGLDIIAYDRDPPQISGKNDYHSPRKEKRGDLINKTRPTFFAVQQGKPETLREHADRVLFLCWPPYDSSMAFECLENYKGKRLVYIGECDGGCTGDELFFSSLSLEWEEVASHKPVQWSGMHDWITVYERGSMKG